MEHIQIEFIGRIQYICISSPKVPQTRRPTVYIQIILHKIINKKSYFLRTVADMNEFYQQIFQQPVSCDYSF
jgi:hypothetical protein